MQISPRLLYVLSFVIVANLIALALVTTFLNMRRKWSDRRSAKLAAALRPQFLAALDGGRLVAKPLDREKLAGMLAELPRHNPLAA